MRVSILLLFGGMQSGVAVLRRVAATACPLNDDVPLYTNIIANLNTMDVWNAKKHTMEKDMTIIAKDKHDVLTVGELYDQLKYPIVPVNQPELKFHARTQEETCRVFLSMMTGVKQALLQGHKDCKEGKVAFCAGVMQAASASATCPQDDKSELHWDVIANLITNAGRRSSLYYLKGGNYAMEHFPPKHEHNMITVEQLYKELKNPRGMGSRDPEEACGWLLSLMKLGFPDCKTSIITSCTIIRKTAAFLTEIEVMSGLK